MKEIKYKKLLIQNFLSIGNDTIEIDFQKGLNLITGINIDNPERKNGTGKSAIIESFHYALFGTTIRDIKKEFVINNVTKGKGRIELIFDVKTDTTSNTYKIVRQLKPSTVDLYKLGDVEENISKDSIQNTNKYINDLIGSNYVICKSCDILSLSDNVPFMAKKPEEKRKFINDIFSLEIFGRMNNDLKNLIRDNKSEISISNAKLEEIDNTLETLNNQQNDYLKKVEEREVVLQQKREEIQSKIDDTEKLILETTIPDVSFIKNEKEKYELAWNKLDERIGHINDQISSKETLRKLNTNEIDKFSSVKEGIKCDKCFQEIPHTHVEHLEKLKEQYQSELVDIIEDIEKLIAEKLECLRKKTKVQDKVSEFYNQINEAKITKQKMEGLKSILEQYKENLNNLKLEELPKSSFEENIINTQERKKKESQNFELLKQKSEDYELCKFILSEEGVRSFVVKRLLSMLNASIQQYIYDLGMNIRCTFDEYFDEQIYNDKGKEISYWNLSGGERRTVDLACAWTFKDIKRKISGISSNLEFLDEILDSAFDPVGYDKLVEVIKSRIEKDNIACYVVSHRKETLTHITGEIINLKKENSITTRIIDN